MNPRRRLQRKLEARARRNGHTAISEFTEAATPTTQEIVQKVSAEIISETESATSATKEIITEPIKTTPKKKRSTRKTTTTKKK